MKKIFAILSICAIAVSAMAMPARRDGIVRTAADGTEKVVYQHGDESFHYITDAEGNWLDEETLLPLSEEAKAVRKTKGKARIQQRRIQQQQNGVGDKPNIAPRGLVVLVSFKNKAFSTPIDTIDAMLNSENYTRDYNYTYLNRTYNVHSEGSVKKYFEDQSYGQYSPIFDVVGPVTLSQNMKYYGENDIYYEQDKRPEEMIKEACELADEQFNVDFTQYDNDNDGLVDFVYVIYAGYGEADGGGENTIWPHQWNLWDYGRLSYYVDGKKLNRYACGCELSYISKQYDGIGTICHEFSHVLGLPDLYVTEDMTNPPHTLCDWDIMDYGPYNNDGNTPPSYSAYERFYMGWVTPRVLTDPEDVTLHPINESKEALLMCTGDEHNIIGWNPSPKTFYLLEARNKEGWDEYLPGQGMLITKITYNYSKWSNNTVNNVSTSMGVDLMEAKSNTTSGQYAQGKSTDAYPSGAKFFTKFADHEITNITRKAATGIISFQYRGGTQDVETVQDGEEKARKIIRDGQVVIIRGGKEYNIIGALLH